MKTNVLLGVFAAIAIILGVYAYFHEGIQRGLSFPGKVGTAADHYFHDGTRLEKGFDYGEITLGDGSVWKYVQADTRGEKSYPSWLIVVWQGPDRQTYILEGPDIHATHRSVFAKTHLSFENTTEMVNSLTRRGFRKTSY